MKRTFSLVTVLILLVVVMAAPLGAAPKPSIEDPINDANGINDQGTGDGSFGDFDPATVSTVGDLLTITFTTDKKNVYVHIETQNPPPATQGVGYRVRVNPDGPGGSYCLFFEAFFPGATNDLTEYKGHLRDACGGGDNIEAVVQPSPLGGTAIIIPRKAHEALGKGKTLTAPQANTFVWTGTYPQGVAYPVLDTTKPGADYKIKN